MGIELSPPLRSLLETIEHFERGEAGVEALQVSVRSAEDSVTEHELCDLRQYLHEAENKLEMIRFMADGEHVFAEALKVARGLRGRVQSIFRPP
jgi:hypothetical protein